MLTLQLAILLHNYYTNIFSFVPLSPISDFNGS